MAREQLRRARPPRAPAALAVLALIGCHRSPAGGLDAGDPPVASTTLATASTSAAALPVTPSEIDPRAPLLSRGPLHVEPISVPGPSPTWLGFLGSAEVARAPWAVVCGSPPGHCEARNIRESLGWWPEAVRVLGHHLDAVEKALYVRVGSVAWLGQPAGLTGVVSFSLPLQPKGEIGRSPWNLQLAGVRSDAEIATRIAALRSEKVQSRTTGDEQDKLNAMFRLAGASATALSRLVVAAGLDVEVTWQRRFRQRLRRLTREELKSAPEVPRLLAIVREAGGNCEWSTIDGVTEEGFCPSNHGKLIVRRASSGVRIQTILLDEPPWQIPVLPPGPPVAARAPTPVTKDTLRELWSDAEILSEAPWTRAGGTIALAQAAPRAAGEPPGLLALFVQESCALAEEIRWEGALPQEVGFADVDGDGRADLVFRPEGANPTVVFSPRHAGMGISGDDVVFPFLRGAEGLDETVRRALAAPRGPVDPARALAAIAARRLAPGARAFHNPDNVEVPIGSYQLILPSCKDPGGFELTFSCHPFRPYCQAHCRTTGGTGEPGTYFTYILNPARHPLAVDAIYSDKWYTAPGVPP